tara:strand:+ start:530 stop:814 length:285 start_codon:yes stop_codon:yes gene_type:complete
VKELSIKVSIAGRVYPLTVKQEEEEGIRKAVKALETMMKDYEQKYAVKDKQDLLAMCALQYATDALGLVDKSKQVDDEIADQIRRLEKEVISAL